MSGRATVARAAQIDGDSETPGTDLAPERLEWVFDAWLACSHPLIAGLGDNIAAAWSHTFDAGRKRSIKQADRLNREAMIRAVVANLAYCVVMEHAPPAFAVSFRAAKQKRSRYERPGFTGLPRMLEMLDREAAGLLMLRKSDRHGIASAITATEAFVRDIRRFKFRPKDFSREPGQEEVWLTRAELNANGRPIGRDLIDYSETHETERLRAEVQRINAIVQTADVAFLDDGGPPVPTGLRSLRRVFNLPPDLPLGTERFDLGGRLYGEAFWLTLPKARRVGIRVQSEPVADLDFSAMFLRLAHVEAGLMPPASPDPYASIEGFTGGHWRDGLKRIVSAMLYRSTPMTQLPKGTRAMLPRGTTPADLRFVLGRAFPGVPFETGIGFRLMNTESRILIAALQGLTARGVIGLPMHDGLMVARSKSDVAAAVMSDAALEITGHRLPITLKAQY